MKKFEGKVVIVAGAGAVESGLSNGMATAVTFARQGAKVFAVDRDLALARETARMIDSEGGDCQLHQCDVTDQAQVDAMVAACVERYGRVDVLFNNVGIHIRGCLSEEPAEFDRVMRVNLNSFFLTMRAVLPHMLAQGGGAIVNNSSVAGIRSMLPTAGYSASKGAVIQLSQNVGVTYASKGIRCNVILPGYIATPRVTWRIAREAGEDKELFDSKLAERATQVPSGKFGEAWDVANAVAFLASDDAKYINATSLVIDGGLSASTTGLPW